MHKQVTQVSRAYLDLNRFMIFRDTAKLVRYLQGFSEKLKILLRIHLEASNFDQDADSSCEWSARCLTSWRATAVSYDHDQCVHEHFLIDPPMHQIGLFPTLHVMWCLKNVTGSDRDDCVISE